MGSPRPSEKDDNMVFNKLKHEFRKVPDERKDHVILQIHKAFVDIRKEK